MKKDKSKNKSPKRKTLRRLIEIGVLVALFVVLCLLKNNQKVSEFFAETFSRWWITAFGTLLGWIPFSLYEIFLIVVIVGAIAFFVIEIVLLCKHKWQKALTSVLVVVICVFAFLNIYTATASFAYNRDPLPTDIYEEYSGDDLTLEEAIKIADYVIEQANQAYQKTKQIFFILHTARKTHFEQAHNERIAYHGSVFCAVRRSEYQRERNRVVPASHAGA